MSLEDARGCPKHFPCGYVAFYHSDRGIREKVVHLGEGGGLQRSILLQPRVLHFYIHFMRHKILSFSEIGHPENTDLKGRRADLCAVVLFE